jgi:hypothetical protein
LVRQEKGIDSRASSENLSEIVLITNYESITFFLIIYAISDKTDVSEAEGTEPEEPEEKLLQLHVEGSPSRNPLVGLLNAIAIVASGVFAGLLGTSQEEKKALQSTISSVCYLLSLISI